ncbi:hypothetical protein BJP27_24595 (plasmid) [Pseudomonas oryzihabitans]|nr:hypothetical protein BJP27_23945 [Pseudomonas psychrotolerans]APQ14751.1 hypothetical protein BJP27_24595 [Pseudomonas psychrotolerans]
MNATAAPAPFIHPDNAGLAEKLHALAGAITAPGHPPIRAVISVLDYEHGVVMPTVAGPSDWRSTVGVLTAAAHAVVAPETLPVTLPETLEA